MTCFRIKIGLLLFLILGPCSFAFATDLIDIYTRAFCFDPLFNKARANRLALGEQLPQQVAGLLPIVSFSANVNWNRNETLRADPPAAVPPGATTFPTKAYLFSFSQPLFNLNNWFLVTRARAIDKQAQAALFAASQDLIARVARAYLEALNAADNLKYAKAEMDANLRQVNFAKKRYQLGVDIVTTVYNAQASYDVSVTQYVRAQREACNTLLALTLLTGCKYDCIEKVKRPVPFLTPRPVCVEDWVCAANKFNWNVISARYTALAAQEQIKAAFANHFPTLSGNASYGPSYGQSTGLVDTLNTTVGLQLNVPIYSGGLIVSQTRQAQYEYLSATAEVENQLLQAITTTRQRFNDVVIGVENLKADQISVVSARTSLVSTEKAYTFGTRSIFDVLIAQRSLYEAERQLANDQYAYLLNMILLKQANGSLTMCDLYYINRLLH